MSRDRFVQVNCALRFDDKTLRPQLLKRDKISQGRELLNLWTPTLRNHFLPYNHITADEQLFLFRGRCGFNQYIPTKPRSKFNPRNRILACAKTFYYCNFEPYVGKPLEGVAKKEQEKHVVLRLVDYLRTKSGRKLSTDNFFTSINLAKDLLEPDITFVMTI